MTSDTDDGDDAIKIEINENNAYKQFFEKGLSALLSNPHFLLLYVPENGSKMQVIRPAHDSYNRRRMIRRINEAEEGIPSFYYALSHLWGITKDNRHIWDEIGDFVDDEDGQPAKPVSMRPEKRDTLLALLKDHPDSYWWIDVSCARTDTPLDIMGDIYACCLECFAMIDCEPDLMSQLQTSIDVVENFAEDDPSQYLHELSHLFDLLFTFAQSKWWERVWTWQEMALPVGDVRLIAETGGHIRNTISLDSLSRNHDKINLALDLQKHELTTTSESENTVGDAYMMQLDKLYTCVNEILHVEARSFNMGRIRCKNDPGFVSLIESLARSTRCCMDPVDYVYGVLGMLQIKMPRMTDSDAVWQLFLSKLDPYLDMRNAEFGQEYRYTISDGARQINLQNVKCMGDVYRDMLHNKQ